MLAYAKSFLHKYQTPVKLNAYLPSLHYTSCPKTPQPHWPSPAPNDSEGCLAPLNLPGGGKE